MNDYQPFAIYNFRSGFREDVDPWLLPRDAFQSLINAHLYRGIVERAEGYQLFARFSWRYFVAMTGTGTTYTVTIPANQLPVTDNFYGFAVTTLGSVSETFKYLSDASATVINLSSAAGGTGTVNLTTGVVTLVFANAPATGTFATVLFAWDGPPGTITSIMGIKPYFASDGTREVMVFDQKRMGIVVNLMGTMATIAQSINGISEVPHDFYTAALFTGDGATKTFSGTIPGAPFLPQGAISLPGAQTQVVIYDYLPNGTLNTAIGNNGIITDNGFGNLTGTGVTTASSFVSYQTGAFTITFATAPVVGEQFDAQVATFGNLFHGNFQNFFDVSNYVYLAFFTNNVDPVMYYDGAGIHFLNTNLSNHLITSTLLGFPNYDLSRALHLFVYQSRLLLMSPVDTTATPNLQQASIYWSTINKPLVWTNNEEETADTSEGIVSFSIINTDLIVRFDQSEKIFRFTGDDISPFRFDATNNNWTCDAPYGNINYDTYFTSLGRSAIVGSDGVNVKRKDEQIPDFTDSYSSPLSQLLPVPWLNQTSIITCYGQRFDDLKEGWLCYNSKPIFPNSIQPSDNVLTYNYLDDTYAINTFPFSCLGEAIVNNFQTWGTTFVQWQDVLYPWGSYQVQLNALTDLGGDHFDTVWELNSGNVQTTFNDPTQALTPVLMSVFTKNFNPFIEQGQLARFGYIDLLVSAYNTSFLRVQFYVNDELYIDGEGLPQGWYQETILNFNEQDAMSTRNQTKVWKRIYVGSVGKIHTIRFYQNILDFGASNEQPINIHAMVLYMKPAGRIFN